MNLTDNAACLAFPKTTNVTGRNARWLTFLSEFDYTIQHLEGKKNVLAHTLSRCINNPARLPLIIRKPDQNKQQQQLQGTTISKHPTTTSLPTIPFYLQDPTIPSYALIASAQVSMKPTSEAEEAATVLTTIKESAGTPPWTQKEKEDYQNEWNEFYKLSTAHMNCEFNACHSRGISTGHSQDCPFLEEYNKSVKAKELSTNVRLVTRLSLSPTSQ